jgi:hypothetical protein
VFRLDTTGVTPALYEPGTVAIHGREGNTLRLAGSGWQLNWMTLTRR